MTVDELIRARRLERVPADQPAAVRRLNSARRHLESAALLARDDPDAAYALLYDAARKAVAAHMQAAGLRARNAPGAHEATARYAAAMLPGPSSGELDRMRRFRNRIEYGTTSFDTAQVEHDLGHASAIVAGVSDQVGPTQP